ncbi:hypothetical protein [Bifidobacterium callitrichidarum]|uniref:Uncharacterized protein n=1 Tax=Bifidobacterium callitrichidarum TaxID=2052941 RepID=A0A2U2N8U0_9BIFI|nr:hypothetical protein [Bifidobacterium callitrichidarum]PWG65596.1 hypothetical protein DF196_06585 [Bifidobacterium callitrichidarum]
MSNTINIFVGDGFVDAVDAANGKRLYRFDEKAQTTTCPDHRVVHAVRHADAAMVAHAFETLYERKGSFVAMFPVIGAGMDDYDPAAVITVANM